MGINFGVDPAKNLLQKARSRGLEAVAGIGEKLPFKADTFDFLLFVVTLCFLSGPSEALREARRALKPGGRIVVCFVPRNSSWGKLYREKKAEGHNFYRHAHFYEVFRVEDLLEEAGFRIEEAVSTLFQEPGAVVKTEEPVDGLKETASFCCVRAKSS